VVLRGQNHARNCSPLVDPGLGPQFNVPGCPDPGVRPDGLLPLSPVGEVTREVHKFVKAHPERGAPYVPVAILLNQVSPTLPFRRETSAVSVESRA